jgi:hypothetical protein
METTTLTGKLTDEAIVGIILKVRNDLIKDYLDERNLREYFESRYNVHDLSGVKIELIKRDLREHINEPVNVDHYQAIIDTIRESGSAALSEGNDQLFYKDLEAIFRNYTF